MTDILGLMSYIGQQGEAGIRKGEDRKLAGLYQQALQSPGDRQNAIAQMAGIRPQAAFDAQKHFGGMDDDARKQLGQYAAAFDALPEEMKAQAYPNLAKQAQALGIPAPGEWNPTYAPHIQKLAQSLGAPGPKVPEAYTLSPGSKRYVGEKLIAEAPFQPQRPDFQLYDGADGPVWLPKPAQDGMAPQTAGGGPGAAGVVMGGAYNGTVNPTQDFPTLAKTPGVQVSSLYRDPAHNAKVGGVQNSYHTKGQAGDFVVPPEQRAAFIAQARSMGYDAIDEGDHVHLEPSRGARATSQFGAGQGVGAIPIAGVRPKPKASEQDKAPAGYRFAANGNLEFIPGGPADPSQKAGEKPTATQIKLANTAKAKLIDLTAIDNQLAQVERSFQPLKGSFSAGPYVGGMIPSPEGKSFDAAVSMLQGMVRKLTRTPGEGAMSDYETKLAQLANPSRSEYESVTAEQIEQLRALIKTTREGYEALLQDAGGNSANVPKPGAPSQPATQQSGGWSIKVKP